MSGGRTLRCALRGPLGGAAGGFTLDASFEVPARGVTALFGPSGCGKTSVLRCIAGLERVAGHLSLSGETWQDAGTFLPPHRRPVGYVFQEASLFAHLSVRDNLFYGARRAARLGATAAAGFDEVVEMLGIAGLLARSPAALSGGERQRVAIGRALLSRPALLLMDEPLSALDRITKDEILPYLERLHAAVSLPVVYVTHDMTEVERLADQLVLMQAGRVVACGPLAALQEDPALPFAARRDAVMTLDAVAGDRDERYGLLRLEVAGGAFTLAAPPVRRGEHRRLSIKAADVSLALQRPAMSSILNVLRGGSCRRCGSTTRTWWP